jgi:hypothetical protein
MAAALVTVIVDKTPTGAVDMEVIKCTTTTTGDWYISQKFSTVIAAFVNDQTTKGGASVTISANNKVTIACTGGDVVDLLIFGRK